jgi:hypothetical protein
LALSDYLFSLAIFKNSFNDSENVYKLPKSKHRRQ